MADTGGGEGGGEMMVSPLSGEDADVVGGYDEQVTDFSGDLDDAFEATNCDCAADLRDAMCDLADRICDIAGRHPEHTDVTAKCNDGRSRCERAKTDVESHCG